MTTFSNILLEKKGGIAYITVNRPKALNALNQQTIEELQDAFIYVRLDESVQGVILTGAGDKAFVAGADIKEISSATAIQAVTFTRNGQRLMNSIESLGKPVIAAVNGFALGGGCELSMACTIRLAVEHAQFGQPEVKLGLIPGFGGSQRLPKLVGKGHALQLILTGDPIDAKEAHRIGLVNEIVPAEELIARAETILSKITSNAPLATRFSIEVVNLAEDAPLEAGLTLESSLFSVCAASDDKIEGTSAFLSKRKPEFSGK